MNKLLVIAAVAALASSANAAPAKTSAKSRKSMSIAQSAPTNAKSTGATSAPGANSQSPAVGSNVINTEQQVKKPAKAWGATFLAEMTMDASVANNPEVKDKALDTTNYVGLSYQVTPATKLGFRQYFSANHKAADAEKNTPAENVVTMMDAALTASYKAGKLFGSDAITPTLYYYAPTSDASQAVGSNGKLRLDAEMDFTLTPKWTVGYYMSGRQALIPTSTTTNAEGKPQENFAKSQLLHFGVLYYNFTDAAQAYTYGGFNHVWRTSEAALNAEYIVGGLGANFTMLGGAFSLNPELALEQQTVKDGADVSGGASLAEKNLKYNLVAAVTF